MLQSIRVNGAHVVVAKTAQQALESVRGATDHRETSAQADRASAQTATAVLVLGD